MSKHTTSNYKDIFLYASRRSGSTLLMEVIASNKLITYSDQPFGLYTITPWNLNLLPLFEYSQIISLDKKEEVLIKNYVSGILKGNIFANAPWRFWRYGLFINSNRTILKITDAKSAIDWFDKKFSPYTVVMTRHPIPQALSVIKNGWELTGKAFTRNDFYRKNYLSKDQFKYCTDIYKKGTTLQKHVLDWTLENLVMLKLLPKRAHWKHVSFEHLVVNSTDIINSLSSSLELGDIDKMKNVLNKPSKSTKLKSNLKINKKISKEMKFDLVSKWKDKIPDSEERTVMEILTVFDLDLYKFGDLYPNLEGIEHKHPTTKQ